MKIIENVDITVGQFVRELERIAVNNPGAIPIVVYRLVDDGEEDRSDGIIGVRTLNKGLIVLETDTFYEEDSDKYLTAALLAEPASYRLFRWSCPEAQWCAPGAGRGRRYGQGYHRSRQGDRDVERGKH